MTDNLSQNTTIIPVTVNPDSLKPSPYGSLIESSYDYKNGEISNSYGVINGIVCDEFNKDVKLMEAKPVVPISYAGDKLYDKITEAFSYVISSSSFVSNTNEYKEYISYAVQNSKYDVLHYSNSIYSYAVTDNKDYSNVDNSFLMKYEDITCKSSTSDKYLTLDENTNIDEYIENIKYSGDVNNTINFQTKEDFCGAFLYPDLDNISQIMTSGGERSNVLIKPGESISIPITFEYFLTNDSDSDSTPSKISKKIIFAIKDNVASDGKYFELEVTGNNSSNFANSIYSSIDNYTLEDRLTE